MKKTLFILASLICIGSVKAQTTKGPSFENNLSLANAGVYSINPTYYEKPKIKFKHSAGPERCQNCMCPLGICIQVPLFSEPLTSAQKDDGYGTAGIQIVNSKLVLSFDQAAALPDGTIPIETNFFIGNEYSSVLGFSKVMIKAGTYKVTNITARNPYGECSFDCIFE